MNLQEAKEENPIVIGDDCWIGTLAIILPGVHIGKQCIVAAGAVVTRSFPDRSIFFWGGYLHGCLKQGK